MNDIFLAQFVRPGSGLKVLCSSPVASCFLYTVVDVIRCCGVVEDFGSA